MPGSDIGSGFMRHLGGFKRICKGKCDIFNTGPSAEFLTGKRRKKSLGDNQQPAIVPEYSKVSMQIRQHWKKCSQYLLLW